MKRPEDYTHISLNGDFWIIKNISKWSISKTRYGVESDGSQIRFWTRNGKVDNDGVNTPKKTRDDETGLYNKYEEIVKWH